MCCGVLKGTLLMVATLNEAGKQCLAHAQNDCENK